MTMATVLVISIAVGILLVPLVLSTATTATSVVTALASKSDPCTVGSFPGQPGYDPVTHEMYIPNVASHSITVLTGTCTVKATITLGSESEPYGAAFYPLNNYMYVTDFALDSVYVISGTSTVTTITDPGILEGPRGIIYDPSDDVMVVADNAGDNVVSIYNTGVYAVSGVGVNPNFVGYDPFWNTLLVPNFGSSNVTILSAEYLNTVYNVPLGVQPWGVAYDPADGYDYISNYGSNNVTVLGGAAGANHIDGTIKGFDGPAGVAFSQYSLAVYIANYGPGSHAGYVYEVSGVTVVKKLLTTAGGEAFSPAYDEANDKMYVSVVSTDEVFVLT